MKKYSLIALLLLNTIAFSDTNTTSETEKAPQAEVKKELEVVPNEYQVKNGTEAKVFFTKFVQVKDLKSATVHIGTSNFEDNTITINIPTKILCDKNELSHGTFIINSDVSFQECIFTDTFIISTEKEGKTSIQKSLGHLKLIGQNFTIEKVKIDILEFFKNVSNTVINNSKIAKVIDEGEKISYKQTHTNLSIKDSFIQEYNLMNTTGSGDINPSVFSGLKVVNSDVMFNGKLIVKSSFFLNSNVSFRNVSFENSDMVNNFITYNTTDKYLSSSSGFMKSNKGCVLHNNINIENGVISKSDAYFLNNVIDTKNLLDDISKEFSSSNITNTTDTAKTVTKFKGLVLSAEQIPDSYVGIGKSISSVLEKCANYSSNKDDYMKYLYYDKNGKKRDTTNPTIGQYEATINSIKLEEFDFSVKKEK